MEQKLNELFDVALSFNNEYDNRSCIYVQILAELVYIRSQGFSYKGGE